VTNDLTVTNDLNVSGDTVLNTLTADDVGIVNQLKVDTINSFTLGVPIRIGTNNVQTSRVELGTALIDTHVLGDLKVTNVNSLVPIGALNLGADAGTGSVNVGQVGINTRVRGNLILPSVGLVPPLNVLDSYDTGFYLSNSVGARFIVGAANIHYYKFNEFVYLFIRPILADANATAAATLRLSDPMPIELRPLIQVNALGTIYDNGLKIGSFIINTDGTIDIGNLDTGLFSLGQPCGFRTAAIFYMRTL
jgi:hypothetical protein